MFTKRTRYNPDRRYEPLPDGTLPFKGVRTRDIPLATPVLEHVMQPGERLDAIATHYFNDPYLWHRILDANPDVLCAADLEMAEVRLAREPEASAAGGERLQREAIEELEVLLIPRAQEGGA